MVCTEYYDLYVLYLYLWICVLTEIIAVLSHLHVSVLCVLCKEKITLHYLIHSKGTKDGKY